MAVTPNRGYVGFVNGDANADVTNFTTLVKIDADVMAALTGASAPASIAMSATGNRAMTAAESEASIIFLSGARTANGNLNLPQRAKAYMIYNGCTGNYRITVNTGAGGNPATMHLPQGASTWLYCDGASVYMLSSSRDYAVAMPASNYSVRTGDKSIFSDDSAANLNHTLPDAGGIGGYEFILKKFGGTPRTTTWTPTGCTIDGAASLVMTTQNQIARIQSDNNNYRIIG